VKTARVTALVAGAAVLAGCGSGTPESGPFSFKPGTMTTIANVKTGATVRCLGIETAPVPPPGQQVSFSPNAPGATGSIQLSHMQNGSLTVVCSR